MTSTIVAPTAQLIMVTGLSGAGRSRSAGYLEDLGWLVVDNIPPALASPLLALVEAPQSAMTRVALTMGSGVPEDAVLPMMARLRSSSAAVRVVFLEASTERLVQRYRATRRHHPLLAGGAEWQLTTAIGRERKLLMPVKAEADLVIDTTELNDHGLRRRITDLFANERFSERTRLTLMSFGYKYGLPLDADLVLDCRFLPNPHWVERLRAGSGLDRVVRDYVLNRHPAVSFLASLERMLAELMPAYQVEGRAYVTMALGCTGGRHRSVAVAEQVAVLMDRLGYPTSVRHRDIDTDDSYPSSAR